jgi:uncharacterized protein (TIGR02246 family)
MDEPRLETIMMQRNEAERSSAAAEGASRDDEQKIRGVIALWHRASAAGDLHQLLPLMAEDVVFLVAGHPPMRGREDFASSFRTVIQHFRIDSSFDIQEIQTGGDWACVWNHLSVTMTPISAGSPKRRAGYTLSIFRKTRDGNWVLARDANLLTEERSTSE